MGMLRDPRRAKIEGKAEMKTVSHSKYSQTQIHKPHHICSSSRMGVSCSGNKGCQVANNSWAAQLSHSSYPYVSHCA